MTAVKIGVSRQVVIPKKLHEELGLAPGDYLDVELKEGKVVMTPKTLVDKKFRSDSRKAWRTSGKVESWDHSTTVRTR